MSIAIPSPSSSEDEAERAGAEDCDDVPTLNRSESMVEKTAADISRAHFWAHYSKHAETMKRKEEEEQELLAKDPLHFARRPSDSAGLRFGTFTDTDIHVQLRITEVDKEDDGSKEENGPPARNLWMEMYERNQAASKIQAWWRRLHGYTYKKEEEKPARIRRRGPQRRVTMSILSEDAEAEDLPLLRRAASVRVPKEGLQRRNSQSGAREHSLPRRATSFRVDKAEQSSPSGPKGPPAPLRRMASTSQGLDLSQSRSRRSRSSSVNAASSEDGQQRDLSGGRRRSSTGLQSDDDELAPWCDSTLRLETPELRRRSSTNAPSEDGSGPLRRRSSTNAPSEDGSGPLRRRSSTNAPLEDGSGPLRRRSSANSSLTDAQQPRLPSRGGDATGRRAALSSARRRSGASDASSDPRWIMQHAAVSGPSSKAGSLDNGPGQDGPEGGVLHHQRLHRLQQQIRSAGLGKPQTSQPIHTPTVSTLKMDPSVIPPRGSFSQEMEVPKPPMFCSGSKVAARRRSVTFANNEADNTTNNNDRRLSGSNSSSSQLPPELKPLYSNPSSKSVGQLEDLLPCSFVGLSASQRDSRRSSRSGLSASQPDSPRSSRSGIEGRQSSSKSPAGAQAGILDQTAAGLATHNSQDMGSLGDMRLSSMASRNSVGSNRLRLLKSRPGYAAGNKLESRRSLSSTSLPNHLSSPLASPEHKPIAMDSGLKSRSSISGEDRGSCPIGGGGLSTSEKASLYTRALTLPTAEHNSRAGADAANNTGLASRDSDQAPSLRYLPDIHQHHSLQESKHSTSAAGSAHANSSRPSSSRLRRHSTSNTIPNPFKDVQLNPASVAFLHGGIAAGSSKSRSSGALQPTRLQSIWAANMPVGDQAGKLVPYPPLRQSLPQHM